MRTGHLFAGAGGGIYADLILGHEPVFAVEWDNYAAGCLQRRIDDGWFAGMHLHHGDVQLFDASEYKGRVDSLHAGFPCQDISVAGSGAGIDGERSGLWSEVVRVAGDLGCWELFLENSPAITGRGLGRVLRDLAELGFDARWCVLPASGVGAPHIRARWWCLARLGGRFSKSSSGEIQQPWRTETERTSENTYADSAWELQQKGRKQEQRNRVGDFCEDVSDSNSERLHGRSTEHRPNRRKVVERNDCMANTDSDSEQRLERSEPDAQNRTEPRAGQAGSRGNGLGWWAVEPPVGRVVNGLANRGNRIKCLGNGQVPLQAAAAYRLLDAGFGA